MDKNDSGALVNLKSCLPVYADRHGLSEEDPGAAEAEPFARQELNSQPQSMGGCRSQSPSPLVPWSPKDICSSL